MEIVIDGKIVSIKHYLNRMLSPITDNGKTKYPLYTQVIFDKKNTRFKAIRDHAFFTKEEIYVAEDKEKDLARIIAHNTDPVIRGVLDAEQKIFKIIEREAKIERSPLKGLSKKFKKYGRLLTNVIKFDAEQTLLSFCKDILIYSDYVKVEQAKTMSEKYHLIKQNSRYAAFLKRIESKMGDLWLVRASILLEEFEKENGVNNSTYYSWLFEKGEERFKVTIKKSQYADWQRFRNAFDKNIFTMIAYLESYFVRNIE